MKKDKKLVIFGTGEIASLAKFYFQQDSSYEVVAFTADDEFVKEDSFEGLPLFPYSEALKRFPPSGYEMHVALSYKKLNQVRRDRYLSVKAHGYRMASYVCSKSVFWSDLTHGDNCFILENQTIQPTVKIGNNVMIWSGNHLGHATVIHDHVYISSHVVISGHCSIGSCSFLGVNATIRDFISIGESTFIAMDASIVKDTLPGSVVLGSRSTAFEADAREARTLKEKYFSL